MSEWIRVKDRLPEPFTSVLVSNSAGVSLDEREATTAYFDGVDGQWYYLAFWDYDLWHKADVTHWMPLPAPPEGI